MSLNDLNMENSIVSQLVQDIFQHAERKGVRETIQHKRNEGFAIAEHLKQPKKSPPGRFSQMEQLALELPSSVLSNTVLTSSNRKNKKKEKK